MIKLNKIPDKSAISNGFETVDYCDSYRIIYPADKSIEQITNELFKLPDWVTLLLKTRDSIVGIFGLKTGKDREDGQRLFPIIEQNKNELVMGENDSHLNFRVSVLIDRENAFVYVTTLVHYNNIWGKLYFMPVKPFHKIIMKSLIKSNLK
ncbi:MAG: DUF2867 domain-containing protein [Prevotellaceae bacterium]|jgi:hypothetical protein|nr:DUF2867 domain-containing protein [Prevotellaceae bacterium]